MAISALLSSAAFAGDCKIIGQIAYCHDWTKDKPKESGKADWNSPIKQYGAGSGNLNNHGTLDCKQ